MVDVRLYIGTLVAVLIFFGLGVLVGIGITREPAAEQFYQRIEKQLQRYREETARELRERDERLRQLEGELTALRQRVRGSEQFLGGLLPEIVRDQLRFRNIALVSATPDSDGELRGRVQAFLQKAGATVPVRFILQPNNIYQADTATWQKVASGLGLVTLGVDEETVKAGVWKRVALLVRYGDAQNSWRVLAQVGWVHVEGETQTPVGSLLLLTASRGRPAEQVQAVDLPFLKALQSVGVRVVVATTTSVDSEELALYQMDGFPTVDHADTPLGLISLVAALMGHPDHYGFGATARRPFPELDWFVKAKQP